MSNQTVKRGLREYSLEQPLNLTLELAISPFTPLNQP